MNDELGCVPTANEVLTYDDNGYILVKLNNDHPFDTLFDFNAEIGDSWRFTVGYYDWFYD